jgi:hypothetical protein
VATTAAPVATTAAPPATTTASYVTPGAYCSPEGANGHTSTGVPMTCTTQSCTTGTTYSQPRWRKATC